MFELVDRFRKTMKSIKCAVEHEYKFLSLFFLKGRFDYMGI